MKKLSINITPGNTNDRNQKMMFAFCKNIYGKLFGDRGYLSQKLFDTLFRKGKEQSLNLGVRQNLELIEPASVELPLLYFIVYIVLCFY